jgi:membrane-associated phospholipid phosphatase
MDTQTHAKSVAGKFTRTVRGFERLVASALLLCVPPAWADESTGIRGALEDVELYYTAPIRWDATDWFAFAGTLAAVTAAHSFDARVRSHFASGGDALNGGKDTNSLRDIAPTAAIIGGTFIGAAFFDDHDGYRETWAMVESGILSSATAEVFGLAAGRERPDATTSPNQWGKGSDSFPSLHATAAFAVGTVFAESGNDDYRWLRRVLGYGIAAGTAYIRIRDNDHWLSDTVAGSALGIATARFVLNRRNTTDHSGAFQIEPTPHGWMLAYNKRF